MQIMLQAIHFTVDIHVMEIEITVKSTVKIHKTVVSNGRKTFISHVYIHTYFYKWTVDTYVK